MLERQTQGTRGRRQAGPWQTYVLCMAAAWGVGARVGVEVARRLGESVQIEALAGTGKTQVP
jgi:hypothetical protein